MHGMHARLPKNFVLEERIERYAKAIEFEPARLRGLWAEACRPLGTGAGPFREVRVDLGCGKGTFAVESALREPDVLFVAIDSEPICVAYAAQHAVEAGCANVVVVPGNATQLTAMFGPGEVGRLHINFPTPFPRKKVAANRLTIIDRLMEYRQVLAQGAELELRTDSEPFFLFTLTQLQIAGYEVSWATDSLRERCPDAVASEYELRLAEQGATVHALAATAGPAPAHVEQTAELSLAEYLPKDLSKLDYVPHGMQATVVNLRNRAAKRSSLQ